MKNSTITLGNTWQLLINEKKNVVTFLDFYLKEIKTHIHKKFCGVIFMAILFIIKTVNIPGIHL